MKDYYTEDIELLKRIRSYLYISPMSVQTVFKSQSQELREAADLAERKEKDLIQFDDLIRRLSSNP